MKKLIPIILVILFSVSCATTGNFNSKSYKTMAVMSTAYNVGMQAAADLHMKGFITAEGYAEIVKYAEVYYEANNEAIDAFNAYLFAPDAEKLGKKKPAKLAISLALIAYNKMVVYFIKYNVGDNKPIEPWF